MSYHSVRIFNVFVTLYFYKMSVLDIVCIHKLTVCRLNTCFLFRLHAILFSFKQNPAFS